MRRRKRAIPAPTKAQRERQNKIIEIGCIIARQRLGKYIPCAVHHQNVGGKHGAKNLGQDFTIGLNDWSHQGYALTAYGWSKADCRRILGPSLAVEPRAFRQTFGDDAALLAYQNELLENPP